MTSRLTAFDPAALRASLGPNAKLYELSHAMSAAMPVYHQHVGFSLALHRRHGDPHVAKRTDGSSFANEVIVTSGHAGTHIDALGHFSRNGCLHDSVPVGDVETRDGLNRFDAAEIPPILQSAVILDVAAAKGVPCLKPAEVISIADIEAAQKNAGVEISAGDAVLLHTGWSQHWSDAEMFIGRKGGMPGPDEAATRWMIDRGATLFGSDTPGFECLPTPGKSVHALLLVDEGIHIIENLNLAELVERKIHRAFLIILSLRIAGSTGSPIRPIAIA
ncbi:MAG: cyclase family protein [Xanthobacteraceae bacterium]